VSSALLLPYYVGSGHRPRWMGVGSFLFSLATLLCASPHLLITSPNVQYNEDNKNTQYCSVGNNFTSCDMDEENNDDYILFGIIFTSLLIIGFGQTAIFTLGIPYLDDNVANRDSPLYFCKY